MPVQQTLYKQREMLILSSSDGLRKLSLSVQQAKLILENVRHIESFIKRNDYQEFKNLRKKDKFNDIDA